MVIETRFIKNKETCILAILACILEYIYGINPQGGEEEKRQRCLLECIVKLNRAYIDIFRFEHCLYDMINHEYSASTEILQDATSLINVQKYTDELVSYIDKTIYINVVGKLPDNTEKLLPDFKDKVMIKIL